MAEVQDLADASLDEVKKVRVLELYSGIGGMHYALEG